MSRRSIFAASMACFTLVGVCAWSFWLPNRTFNDERTILDREHIDYGVALADSEAATSSRYELRFLRTSADTLRVDIEVSVENQAPAKLDTTCYYLVPPGSEILNTNQIDGSLIARDRDGSFTITGDDLDRWEVPFFNTEGVKLAQKYSDQGFWLYSQACRADAAPSNPDGTSSSSSWYGASFTVPNNVFFRTAYRTYELDFNLQGIPTFLYAGDDIPKDDAITQADWIGAASYELDGKGWTVSPRVPNAHQLGRVSHIEGEARGSIGL